MQIYTVRKGDSLYGIARAFNSSVAEITEANKLSAPADLVVGQTLVIPITGSFYYVQPGDSLYLIGKKFGVDYRELARINGIPIYSVLYPGERLYIPSRPKTDAESNAYIEPPAGGAGEALLADARNASPLLSYLATFSYRINADGSLSKPNTSGISEAAAEGGASPMMVVTNIKDGRFDAELAKTILESEELQNTLLNNIVAEAKAGGYGDVHFDLEFLPPDQRENYNAFLRKAAERLRPEGLLISSALAPKTSAAQSGQWYEAHDYRAHGEIVDFVIIMTYEWGYSGGPPQPVSPINEVEKVLNYAVSEIPPQKIMMGQNLYGYDWTLPFVPGGQYARAVSPQRAIDIARENNAQIFYDEKAQAPYFDYYDAEGKAHKVWFEDARSIQAKFDLLKRLNLRGISYWKLGLPFPQNWLLLGDNFDIQKRNA